MGEGAGTMHPPFLYRFAPVMTGVSPSKSKQMLRRHCRLYYHFLFCPASATANPSSIIYQYIIKQSFIQSCVYMWEWRGVEERRREGGTFPKKLGQWWEGGRQRLLFGGSSPFLHTHLLNVIDGRVTGDASSSHLIFFCHLHITSHQQWMNVWHTHTYIISGGERTSPPSLPPSPPKTNDKCLHKTCRHNAGQV